MPDNPPYMTAYGQIPKVLDKIKAAQTPEKFTYDFLNTQLNVKASGARPFIPFAKKIGLLSQDGTPTEIYNKFRSTNQKISGGAIAKAIKIGYSEIYIKNEYAHKLSDDDLKGLIIELTGLEEKSKTLVAILKSFNELKQYADFSSEATSIEETETPKEAAAASTAEPGKAALSLKYSINLILPSTSDISVFNAIFKSIKEHLLD